MTRNVNGGQQKVQSLVRGMCFSFSFSFFFFPLFGRSLPLQRSDMVRYCQIWKQKGGPAYFSSAQGKWLAGSRPAHVHEAQTGTRLLSLNCAVVGPCRKHAI
jgi:hypothetical protein